MNESTRDGASDRGGDAPAWMTKLARFGYASRGTVFVLIGVLALLAAFGSGGSTGGSRNALASVVAFPGGWLLLAVLCVGLLAFAVWRFIQSVMDADGRGTDAKGLAVRGTMFLSGLIYLTLSLFAGRLAIGAASGGGGGDSKEDWTAWLLGQPFGRWLVIAVGLGVIAAGIVHVVKAFTSKWEEKLSAAKNKLPKIKPVCVFGLTARGVVFVIIGGFFVWAGWTSNASDAGGMGQMFATVRSQPFGTVLLVVVAAGLAAFGVYGWVEAAYRRINGPDAAPG